MRENVCIENLPSKINFILTNGEHISVTGSVLSCRIILYANLTYDLFS